MPPIKFKYQIDVWYEDYDWLKDRTWFAEVWAGENHWITSGKTEEEIWDMVGDSILTVNTVKVSWWNKLLWKLRKY